MVGQLEHSQTARRTALFQSERQRKIVSIVEEYGSIEVTDLAGYFDVTTETIRRDLSELQAKRLVKRVHGGAVSWKSFEPLVSKRTDENDEDKRRIASRAVEELPDAGSVLIDAGSTLLRFAEAIPAGRELHVVTNSLPTAQAVANSQSNHVSILGGEIRTDTMSVVDAQAVEEVRQLHVDVLFISTDGASINGLTTPYSYEASLKRAMIAAARTVVALIDPSKFDHDQMLRFASWDDIDTLITGVETSRETLDGIRSLGVEVVLV